MSLVQASRHRHSKRPTWILILLFLVCFSLMGAYIYQPHHYKACHLFASNICNPFRIWLPSPTRELTDNEIIAHVVLKDILKIPNFESENPKIAFMFLTPGSLPFEKLWERFFHGHDGRYSIYMHASREKPVHTSSLFMDRDIRSVEVVWGTISMIDAERRLLANALQDPDNQHFVLLSDSCVPLHNFDYVYNYLMYSNISFIDRFEDPGPIGNGRYSSHMLPEVELKDFMKGSQYIYQKRYIRSNQSPLAKEPTVKGDVQIAKSANGLLFQWFSMKRKHALLVLADNLYYSKFKQYCKPGMEGDINCYSDEHYLPTLFNMMDPNGIANWSVTHVDWSEMKYHPKSYRTQDVTFELLKNISSIDMNYHITSDIQRKVELRPCLWNGKKRPCYLFARKFSPETLDVLVEIFDNYTSLALN